jgi:fatty-acyl-CoA synthase
MLGLMQDYPLLTHTILEHGALNHGEREMVTRGVEGPIRRTTLAEVRNRALRVAKALEGEGVRLGDRVATMAWNTERHVETWFGIMGTGAICHTLNPRLFAEQLDYIVNHAEDGIMFVDLTFLPIVEALKDRFSTVRKYIVLTDAEHLPETSLPGAVAYEDWIAAVDEDYQWKASNVLHGLTVNQPDVFGLRSEDVILAIVPMFHANAWALTYAVPAAGAKLVMPGPGMDGKSIYELLEHEQVSATAAVPTVWLGLLQYLQETGKELPYLKRVVVGGAACPPMMIRKFEVDYGVEVIHGWGMTEMSPVGTTGKMKHATSGLEREDQLKLKEKQGRTPYLVEMKIVDDDGKDLPRDGKSFGHLLVKGPAVVKGYFRLEDSALDEGGWFDTGDIATIDPLGYMQITDRDKDVIKSGGEWISSIEVENVAVGCPGVAEAAVIGLPHPKWSERPLLICVREQGSEVDEAEVLAYLEGKIAKWWIPEDVVFVDELPHTATGKIQKMDLRECFKDFEFSK